MSHPYFDSLVALPSTWLSWSLRDPAQLVSRFEGGYAWEPAPYYVTYDPAWDAAKVVIASPGNNLLNQIRLPLGTSDGHSFFFTWDVYVTDSYLGVSHFNNKWYQLSSGGGDGHAIWLEFDLLYGGTLPPGMVGAFHMRSMQEQIGPADWLASDGNSRGPSSTDFNPLSPSTPFYVAANRWTRVFCLFDQRLNDYDYVTTWLADEDRDPVEVVHHVPVSVRPTGPTPNSISYLWGEWNTSSVANVRPDGRDLIQYWRNVWVGIDVPDPQALLMRPEGGSVPPPSPIHAPTNVRMI